jgi:cytosine deaminase
MIDYVVRNARVAGREGPLLDIGFENGRIAALEPKLVCDAPEYDAGGCLCCSGLIETHIHLDKSRIYDRCAPEAGREAQSMQRVSAVKHTFTVEDVHARAAKTLEECIKHGTTRMRAHCEVDPLVGLRGFEGVKGLIDEYKWAIDLQICVMPQEGLTNNPGTDELMVAALENGATVVGAAPNYDTDKAGQIRRIFELSHKYGFDIDMHLDSGNSIDDLDIPLVCELTEKYKMGGRVAIGHATKLSTVEPEKQKEFARRLGDVGVAVTILPATDLFMMGRNQSYNVRRGLVDANLFVECGCNCSISTNNILNPFTPFGDCSLLRMANLHANVLQVSKAERIAECFEMVSSRSARLMNLKDYGIAVGNPADVVVLDAEGPRQAVAQIGEPVAVFKRGRRTVTRHRTELHRPN